tara:strand:- start:118 stop:600 length:483 start_codon:yes stop_codon:yes gene_type:complete
MMNNDEYREFWERFLGRYPDFKPTKEQTEDWRRELQFMDPYALEAAVATVVKEKSSVIPRLPWLVNAYYRIKKKRTDDIRDKSTNNPWEFTEEDKQAILDEREAHLQQLKGTHIDDLRSATITVLRKYKKVLTKPEDGDVEGWSKWLRAAVWCELYGGVK